MDLAATHLGYVFAAYGLSALVLVGITLWVLLRDRALQAKLKDKQ